VPLQRSKGKTSVLCIQTQAALPNLGVRAEWAIGRFTRTMVWKYQPHKPP
jgi:hypothetical protein